MQESSMQGRHPSTTMVGCSPGKESLVWKEGNGVAFLATADGRPGFLGAVTMLTGRTKHHFEVNGGGFFGKGNYNF